MGQDITLIRQLPDHLPSRRRVLTSMISGTIGISLAYGLLIIGALVMILPFIWMLSASFMPLADVVKVPPLWIPSNPTFDNYAHIWGDLEFSRYFLNSTVVAVAGVSLTIITSSLAGYAFAKYRFYGSTVLFIIVLSTLMIPFQVRMVPLYVMFAQVKILDTFTALILPSAFSGFGIFLMRQFIQTIPTALIEAARIDGANEPTILFRVVLPLLKPALATLTIFTFQGNWDSFLWPLIVTSSSDMRTLPLGLAKFTEQYIALTHLQMAGSIITTIPIILVFFAMQRHFIQGIALSGIKG